MLDFIPDIGSERDCKQLCREKAGCEIYTFYLEDDPYHGSCLLLSSLQQPIQDCPSCVTGPSQCDAAADCRFSIYYQPDTTYLMFKNIGRNDTLTTNGGSYFAECELRVLAVGGGGYGAAPGKGYGGGGSGFIQYYTQTYRHKTEISLIVGDHDEASTININTADDTLVASAGQYGGSIYGGDGYSGGGGGGSNAYNGGSDGGDGEVGS